MNKTLEYYMNLPYRLEIVPDREEGGYTAYYPDLPGCITCSDTINGLIANMEDAKKAWLEAALADGLVIQEPGEKDLTDYSGQFKIRVPKSLHKSLSLHAKDEGISMNQYCVYLLSMNDALVSSNRTAK